MPEIVAQCKVLVDKYRRSPDKDYQRNGYGKLSLLELKNIIKNKFDGDKLYTSVKPENNVAKNLYERVDFKWTGEIRWGEEILKVDL